MCICTANKTYKFRSDGVMISAITYDDMDKDVNGERYYINKHVFIQMDVDLRKFENVMYIKEYLQRCTKGT